MKLNKKEQALYNAYMKNSDTRYGDEITNLVSFKNLEFNEKIINLVLDDLEDNFKYLNPRIDSNIIKDKKVAYRTYEYVNNN